MILKFNTLLFICSLLMPCTSSLQADTQQVQSAQNPFGDRAVLINPQIVINNHYHYAADNGKKQGFIRRHIKKFLCLALLGAAYVASQSASKTTSNGAPQENDRETETHSHGMGVTEPSPLSYAYTQQQLEYFAALQHLFMLLQQSQQSALCPMQLSMSTLGDATERTPQHPIQQHVLDVPTSLTQSFPDTGTMCLVASSQPPQQLNRTFTLDPKPYVAQLQLLRQTLNTPCQPRLYCDLPFQLPLCASPSPYLLCAATKPLTQISDEQENTDRSIKTLLKKQQDLFSICQGTEALTYLRYASQFEEYIRYLGQIYNESCKEKETTAARQLTSASLLIREAQLKEIKQPPRPHNRQLQRPFAEIMKLDPDLTNPKERQAALSQLTTEQKELLSAYYMIQFLKTGSKL